MIKHRVYHTRVQRIC